MSQNIKEIQSLEFMNRHISSSFARLTVLLEAERRCRFLFANAAGVRENMVYFSGCVPITFEELEGMRDATGMQAHEIAQHA